MPTTESGGVSLCRIAAVRNSHMSQLAAATVERWFTPAYRATHPEEMVQTREMIAATKPEGYAACCAVLRDTNLRSEVGMVEAASLVVTGTRDPATPSSRWTYAAWGIPNSRYVELDASHLSAMGSVQTNSPERCCNMLPKGRT